MLWVPLIPLIVFLLSLVPAFYFGFRIGWRTALFISLLLFIFVGLFAITLYFSYQQTVWPWWKSIYLKKELNSDSGINVDLFSEINSIKKVGVLFSIGCLTPLALLFTLVIYQLVKRPLNKYLGHSTKDDDKQVNKKKILIFKNRKPAKIAGGVILITNTVLVGSLVTSAANAAFVPLNKRSGFSKFTDTLGSIYGIGLGNNNLPSQVIHNFLNKLNSKMTNSILEFANVKQKQFSKGSSFMNKDLLNYIIDAKEILEDIFSNEEAAYQLFNAIMSQSTLNSSINPLIFIPSIVSSNVKNGNQIGYNNSNFYYSLPEIEKWFKANEFIFKQFKFPNKVKESFLQTIKDNFKPFNLTFSASNVNRVKNLLTDNQKTIVKLISEKNKLLLENSKFVAERRNLLSSILPNLSGNSSNQPYVEYNIDDVLKTSNQSTGKTYTFNGYKIIQSDRSIIDSWFTKPASSETPGGGTFDKNLDKLTNSLSGAIYDKFEIYIQNKKISDQEEVKHSWYSSDYKMWYRTKYIHIKNELSDEKERTKNLENESLHLIDEKKRLERSLNDEQNQLGSNKKALNEENRNKTYFKRLILELKAKLKNLGHLKDKTNSAYENAENKFKTNTDEINQVKFEIAKNEESFKKAKSKISNLENSIKENQSAITRLKPSIIIKEKDIENKNIDIRDQKIVQAKKQKEFDRLTIEKDSKKTRVNSMLDLFNKASTIINNNWNELSELISKYNVGIKRLQNLNLNIINKEIRYKVLSETDNKYKVRAENAGAYNHSITTKLSIDQFEALNDQTDSIYYQKQKREFLRVKKDQLEEIESNLQKQYDIAKTKIIQYYKNWIKI